MLSRMRWLRAGGGAAAALALMLAASGVSLAHPHWAADHAGGPGGDHQGVVGVVTSLVFKGSNTASSSSCTPAKEQDGSNCGVPVGTLTVTTGASPTGASFTVLSTTRFTMSGSALAESLVGDWVTVRSRTTGSATDAIDVTVAPPGTALKAELTGTVTAVNGTTSITVDTQSGSVTDALSSSVTVTVGDGQPGALENIKGDRVSLTWTVVKGQVEVVAIRVMGQSVRYGMVFGTASDVTTTKLTVATRNGSVTWPWAQEVTVTDGERQHLTVSAIKQNDRVLVFTQKVGGTVEVVGVRILNNVHKDN